MEGNNLSIVVSHDFEMCRSPEDWDYVGNVSCVTRESLCTSQEDLSDSIQRGNPIAIAGEAHVVRILNSRSGLSETL